MKSYTPLMAALFSLLAIQKSYAARIYVKAGIGGSHTGTSWTTAYDDIQPALTAAVAGDSIFVAAGIYLPSIIAGTSRDPRDKTFLLKDQVNLLGGFAGTEVYIEDRDSAKLLGLNASVLSGNIGLPDSSDNTYHVVTGVDLDKSVMDGFVIRDGNANGSGSNIVSGKTILRDYGGGIYLQGSHSTLSTLLITKNLALSGGGGLNNEDKSNIRLSSSFIEENRINGENTSFGGGGGLRNAGGSYAFIFQTDFSHNTAYQTQGGGGLRNERNSLNTLTGVTLVDNHATGGASGGAMYNDGYHVYCEHTEFINNTTTGQGGAIYNNISSLDIYSTNFIQNSADKGAGAIKNENALFLELHYTTFTNNSTPGNGGALQNKESYLHAYHTTFSENKAGTDGGAVYNEQANSSYITSCTFHKNYSNNNGGAIFNTHNSTLLLTSSLITLNKAGNSGGGIYNSTPGTSGDFPSSLILTNVSIARNEAGYSGGGYFDDGFGRSWLRNSIVTGNTAPVMPDLDAPAAMMDTSLFHTIIAGQYFKTGLLSLPVTVSTPIFLDPALEDFRLAPGSPAINKGDSNYFSATAIPNLSGLREDLRGANRIMGTNIDLGAYETCSDTTAIAISVYPDTAVNAGDLVIFTALITNPGYSPVCIWMKNGIEVYIGNTLSGMAGREFIDGDKISVRVFFAGYSSNPCFSKDTLSGPSKTMLVSMGISEKTAAEQIHIVPNPSNGHFRLESAILQDKDYTVAILDIAGRELYHQSFKAGNTSRELNLSNQLQAGTYFLTVTGPDQYRKTLPFTIQ